ncbi:hypothetical protein K1719_034016 [Acacia pycnantha]|nr:hypothetical protein K1719_034016 [Acacia pycnantha]
MSQVKASFRSERRNRGRPSFFSGAGSPLVSGLIIFLAPASLWFLGVAVVLPRLWRWEFLSQHLFHRWPLARRWSSARRWPLAQCDIEIHPPVSLSRTRHRSQRIRDSFRE